jgi:hypothetical protein
VLDLEPITSRKEALLVHKLGVSDRCKWRLFKDFSLADVYMIRMTLILSGLLKQP